MSLEELLKHLKTAKNLKDALEYVKLEQEPHDAYSKVFSAARQLVRELEHVVGEYLLIRELGFPTKKGSDTAC